MPVLDRLGCDTTVPLDGSRRTCPGFMLSCPHCSSVTEITSDVDHRAFRLSSVTLPLWEWTGGQEAAGDIGRCVAETLASRSLAPGVPGATHTRRNRLPSAGLTPPFVPSVHEDATCSRRPQAAGKAENLVSISRIVLLTTGTICTCSKPARDAPRLGFASPRDDRQPCALRRVCGIWRMVPGGDKSPSMTVGRLLCAIGP